MRYTHRAQGFGNTAFISLNLSRNKPRIIERTIFEDVVKHGKQKNKTKQKKKKKKKQQQPTTMKQKQRKARESNRTRMYPRLIDKV